MDNGRRKRLSVTPDHGKCRTRGEPLVVTCGFGSLLPYFYPIYFAFLLIHRERRDHQRCAAKYGEDWDRYCRRVRWRIVPGLY